MHQAACKTFYLLSALKATKLLYNVPREKLRNRFRLEHFFPWNTILGIAKENTPLLPSFPLFGPWSYPYIRTNAMLHEKSHDGVQI